jgi:hypothetical protein
LRTGRRRRKHGHDRRERGHLLWILFAARLARGI